ncbi:MAG: hypothetical protein VCE43_06075 [Myxococcota bacterium]
MPVLRWELLLMHHSACRIPIRSRLGALSLAGWLVSVLCWGAPATATQVFHSPNDDGQPASGTPTVATGGVQSVFLYIDGGASASAGDTACDTGTGSEVCGYTLTLTGLTGLTLAGFTPDVGANLLHDITTLEFRVNGLDTVSPNPGPKRIGELTVNAVAGGSLELTLGEVIGADLSSEILASGEVVAVPEPGMLLQLAAGISLLRCLASRRARS